MAQMNKNNTRALEYIVTSKNTVTLDRPGDRETRLPLKEMHTVQSAQKIISKSFY
jgi:hypothetical protein